MLIKCLLCTRHCAGWYAYKISFDGDINLLRTIPVAAMRTLRLRSNLRSMSELQSWGGLGERSPQLQAPNSSNSTPPPPWRSWLGAGSRIFLYSLLILAHLWKPHPSPSRAASRSQSLKSTSGGRGLALGKQLQIYTSSPLPSPRPGLSVFKRHVPPPLPQPAPTTAGLKNASPAQRHQARPYTHVTSVKSCPNCGETDMVSSPSIHEHLKRVRHLLKNSTDVQ